MLTHPAETLRLRDTGAIGAFDPPRKTRNQRDKEVTWPRAQQPPSGLVTARLT